MKKTLLTFYSLIFTLTLFAQNDPVLMEIDGNDVTKSEFLQIYLKNNNAPKYDQASLDEYMELFTKFKLKVAEAEKLGYDTIPRLKKELAGYQNQLALPYLIDSAQNEVLVKEAYDRLKNEVRASHILIRMESNASPEDTLRAYNQLLTLKARIEKGEDFAYVARGKNGSEDPSVTENGGDLGYFTAFQMVYPFEEQAYNTPVGSVSEPFRTRFGFHILKVTDKRAARGTIKVAHLMIAARKDQSTNEQIEAARKKADELYTKIQNGENFENLVNQFSDDPSSNGNGGILPIFGSGTTTRMVSEFEDAAFSLKNDGDISEPVQTDYGFHIIKRIELTGISSYDDLEKELQGRVNRDSRSKKTQASFVAKLKKEYNYKDKTRKSIKWFNENLDSSYFVGRWNADDLKTDKVMFIIDGEKFHQQQFATYLESNFRNIRRDLPATVVKNQFTAWEKEMILSLEKAKLSEKHPEYKALMTEYHDGILLYEIMSDKVWNKAMNDTSGLMNYFHSNRANYVWGERVNAVAYECLNMDVANSVYKMLSNGISEDSIVSTINADSELNLRIRNNKFEVDKTSYIKDNLSDGLNMPYESEGKYYVVNVKEHLPSVQKEFHEARGAITSDYQNHLEKEWLKELNAKHSVKVHKDVLYSLGK